MLLFFDILGDFAIWSIRSFEFVILVETQGFGLEKHGVTLGCVLIMCLFGAFGLHNRPYLAMCIHRIMPHQDTLPVLEHVLIWFGFAESNIRVFGIQHGGLNWWGSSLTQLQSDLSCPTGQPE